GVQKLSPTSSADASCGASASAVATVPPARPARPKAVPHTRSLRPHFAPKRARGGRSVNRRLRPPTIRRALRARAANEGDNRLARKILAIVARQKHCHPGIAKTACAAHFPVDSRNENLPEKRIHQSYASRPRRRAAAGSCGAHASAAAQDVRFAHPDR